MSARRNSRVPISCEPCRIRKIRCPRDATPCATCVRRGVSRHLCRYARKAPQNGSPDISNSSIYAYPRSPESSQTSGLAERVQRLEQLVQAQSTAESTSPSPLSQQRRSTYARRDTNLAGALRTTESGHVRFIARGFDFQSELTLSENGTSTTATRSSKSYPIDDIARSSTRDLLAGLPPRNQCHELVRIFFTSFASLFHVLHDPTFYRQYDCFERDPESMPLAWLALLYAILGTAVSGLPGESHILHDLSRSSSPLARMTELAERYRTMSLRCLEADHYLWDHNTMTLQALVVLIYGMGHAHGPAWTLLGTAHHLALSIGAHVDPATFGLDVVECEERRRCWAGFKMLYTSQNTTIGHIGAGNIFAASNCLPPADVDDVDLMPGQLQAAQTPSRRATQMTYLLFKFRLFDLGAEICDRVLQQKEVEQDTIAELDDRIWTEMCAIESQYLGHTQSESLPVHHLAHINVLRNYADHLVLLLHHNNVNTSRHNQFLNRKSLERCLSSAKRLLETHAVLQESPELSPFRWYSRGLGGFYAFHAAVLLISLNRDDLTEVRGIILACLSRFKEVAELSPLCARAAPLLEQLLERAAIPHLAVNGNEPRADNYWLSQQLGSSSSSSSTSSTANTYTEPHNLSAETVNWNDIWSEFQAQQWISPSYLPWEQWNSIISNPIQAVM